MDEIDTLSDYEKSDYLAVLSSILKASGRDFEAAEATKRSEGLFKSAEAQSKQESEEIRFEDD